MGSSADDNLCNQLSESLALQGGLRQQWRQWQYINEIPADLIHVMY